MQKVLHETCEQYVARRLSEGWKIVHQQGYHLILSSPEGNILRPVDLRNDVETLRPCAPIGDEESIADVLGDGVGTHYTVVDEETPDGDTTVVYTDSTTYERDLYNLPASSGSGTINFIKIYFCVYTGSVLGAQKARPALKSNTTVTDGTEIAVTNSWTTHSQQWNTNPANGAWEWSDIDALQIGISLKTSSTKYTSRCTQVYVEVDYTTEPRKYRIGRRIRPTIKGG